MSTSNYSKPTASPLSNNSNWFLLCHLSALSGLVVPFGNIPGPLLIWQIKKAHIPEIEPHGKNALNFQITMSIVGMLAALLTLVFVGLVLIPVVLLVWLTFTIIAGIKAAKNELYTYPIAIPFLK